MADAILFAVLLPAGAVAYVALGAIVITWMDSRDDASGVPGGPAT